MIKKRYYNKIQYKYRTLFLLLCFSLFFVQPVAADVLYLKDGSVLSGDILEETAEDFLISNSKLGQLYVLREDIIYRETLQINTLSESYTIVGQTFDVIARLSRSVPGKKPDADSFNMLVPASVLTVIDANELDIAFNRRPIGDSDLITIDYDQLNPDTNRLTIVTRQAGLIQEDYGLYTLQLKYILNEDSRVRVIIRYPKVFHLETIKPEPKIKCNGLIVLDQKVKRQQHFMPEFQFIP